MKRSLCAAIAVAALVLAAAGCGGSSAPSRSDGYRSTDDAIVVSHVTGHVVWCTGDTSCASGSVTNVVALSPKQRVITDSRPVRGRYSVLLPRGNYKLVAMVGRQPLGQAWVHVRPAQKRTYVVNLPSAG
jgi:hypothetical protein